MSENTSPDIATAVAALLAAVGQTQSAVPAAPVTMLTVSETAELLRCSESLIYAQLKDGRLRGVKVGRRRLVPMSEINRLIDGEAAAA
ncbi:helix-turn-helix domain-containing protein [Mycolicibacterium farcinogenes]|uniref:Helix-turn-helix domain-containing protein n=1 Tax=Mycolicibacterium farcinogenes TaxID=1802 RepID=A0ACD1FI30_MYCFR|nr:helix-turn-helix domain-containing protein [Mycolicibacterium farcinogenes]QZH66706.1 helix-turn-helix domain-containing protein [Mycolicibacterium farcinogenes]